MILVTKIPGVNEEAELENWAYFFSQEDLNEELEHFVGERWKIENPESGTVDFSLLDDPITCEFSLYPICVTIDFQRTSSNPNHQSNSPSKNSAAEMANLKFQIKS